MKKHLSIGFIYKIIAVVLSVSMFLDYNVAFSSEVNIINKQNNIQIEAKNDVRLEDDFYEAINSEWISKTKLQRGNVSYGTFEELSQKVTDNINNIIIDIKDNKTKYSNDSDEIKVLNLYENYLDIKTRDELGVKPIEKYIKEIDNVKNIEDLKKLLRNNEFSYFQSLINLGVRPDYKDSNINVLYIFRSNLGLGNSSYYKDNSNLGKKIKDAYIDYLIKLNVLYGEPKNVAKQNSQAFYELENKIAQIIPSVQEEARDFNRIEKSYNIYKLDELEEYAPNINFPEMFKEMNINDPKKIIVEDPEELKLINELLKEENLEKIKSFMTTSVLINTDNLLTSDFIEASKDLEKILYGIQNKNFDYTSGVKFTTFELEEVISKLYVTKYFNEESKGQVNDIVKEIISNFENRLQKISWMSNTTRQEALNKLQNLSIKIGYPNKWNDYSNIKIKSYDEGGSLVENAINIYVSQINRQFLKLNKEVDKEEWNMGSYVVNAYYNPMNNEIVFPAGILQAPFYDENASKEKNLGGIGAVIGHELTHAFDNIGSQFDENGKLKKWWTDEDYKEFIKRSKKVSNYYSNIKLENGKMINGFLTVGENISDLGGFACVLDIAKSLENPNLKELFENYASIWREVSTEEIKEYLLNNDPHAPKKVRVNGVLSQFEDFYKTYNIKEGDKMYVKPEERVGIW